MSLLDRLGEDERERLQAADFPEWVEPMLATLQHDPFEAAEELEERGWVTERKLDGMRILAFNQGGDALVYAGKVGTGFSEEELRGLRQRLDDLERDGSPFAGEEAEAAGVHFVDPELVGEFGFTEWTDAGKLRHPRFLGLREDKDSAEVVREDRS